jgi:hypothetical protein
MDRIRILIQRIFDEGTREVNIEEIADLTVPSNRLAAAVLREAANELDPKPMVPKRRPWTDEE